MEPTPLKILQRIIELDQEGKPTKEIAGLFKMCKSAVRRIKQQFRERGSVEARPRRSGARGKFTDALRAKLGELVRHRPAAPRGRNIFTASRRPTPKGLPPRPKRP